MDVFVSQSRGSFASSSSVPQREGRFSASFQCFCRLFCCLRTQERKPLKDLENREVTVQKNSFLETEVTSVQSRVFPRVFKEEPEVKSEIHDNLSKIEEKDSFLDSEIISIRRSVSFQKSEKKQSQELERNSARNFLAEVEEELYSHSDSSSSGSDEESSSLNQLDCPFALPPSNVKSFEFSRQPLYQKTEPLGWKAATIQAQNFNKAIRENPDLYPEEYAKYKKNKEIRQAAVKAYYLDLQENPPPPQKNFSDIMFDEFDYVADSPDWDYLYLAYFNEEEDELAEIDESLLV